jgi:hypothetical protein
VIGSTRQRRAYRGRHSVGRRYRSAPGRQLDLEEQALALQVDQMEPGWVVLYRPYTRDFHAIPCVEGCGPVTSPTVEHLQAAMREAEIFRRGESRS